MNRGSPRHIIAIALGLMAYVYHADSHSQDEQAPPPPSGTIEVVYTNKDLKEQEAPAFLEPVELVGRQCIYSAHVKQIEALDNDTLAFHMRNGEVWHNNLRGNLFGTLSRPLVMERMFGNKYCCHDRVGVLERDVPSAFFPYTANLGTFLLVTPIQD